MCHWITCTPSTILIHYGVQITSRWGVEHYEFYQSLPLEKFGDSGGEWTRTPRGFAQGVILGGGGYQMEGHYLHGLESGVP